MILETRVTSRPAGTNVENTLSELRALRPEWCYVGRVNTIELFRICLMME